MSVSYDFSGKVALITGSSSGIGAATAILFAKSGAKVVVTGRNEKGIKSVAKQCSDVSPNKSKALEVVADVTQEEDLNRLVKTTIDTFGRLDILVNNAGMQVPEKELENITDEAIEDTFRTNIFAYFYFAKAALEYLHEGDSIINTTSVTAYRSSPHLIDYSATKGAITSFTRSLATNLAKKNIRVNGVAPGPVWTPLIVSTFDEKKIKSFGSETAMERAGQPSELAPAYVFLASDDASFITGQVIHVNGGEVVNG